MNEDIDELIKINQIIQRIGRDRYFTIGVREEHFGKPILRLISENILVQDGRNYYFTNIGQHILKLGSYENYLQELEDQKEHQKRLDKATLDSADATIKSAKSAKSSMIAAWFSAGLALIAIIVGVLQYVDGKEKDVEINELKSKFAKLDSLTSQKLQNVVQKSHLVDSSSIHQDSLKR